VVAFIVPLIDANIPASQINIQVESLYLDFCISTISRIKVASTNKGIASDTHKCAKLGFYSSFLLDLIAVWRFQKNQ
jgi:hypothetical protein